MKNEIKEYLLEESIGYIVRNFTKALREKILSNFKEQGFDIAIEEWIALAFLWRFDDKNQQQLGELLIQDKTAVTRLIDNMERSGTVIRQINPMDKRNKIINLTDKGRELYSKLVKIVEATLLCAYGNIEDYEVDQCKKTILKMKENLEKNPIAV